jgi:hypothetical protein
MPYWSERLDEATITALSIYVHALGGGEPEIAAENDDAIELGSLELPASSDRTEIRDKR